MYINGPEPVTISFFKTYSRLTLGESEDEVLEMFIAAAREKAESYCNRDFVSKRVTRTFPINQYADIPAEDIVSVSGYYTSVDDLVDAFDYFNGYVKGISINREYPIDWNNLPTYTVTYDVTVDTSYVPSSVKVAICKFAADLYENRENSSDGLNKELSIHYKALLAPYRIDNK